MKEQDLFGYAGYLLSLALKKADNFEQAEDLVSETLMSTLVSLRGGRKIENPKSYLSAILNHKFNDFLRSKYSRPTVSYGVIPKYDFASKEISAVDNLIQKEEEENVRRIISQLSEKYREVLVRHFIHGQNVGDIAEAMGINVNTVKSRLNTARMTVKNRMEKGSMEKYEKQSYEPEQLDIWVYGEMEEEDIPLVAPKFFEAIDKYEELNLLGKEPVSDKDGDGSIVVLNIPVLTADESEEIFGKIIHDGTMDFSSAFERELGELFVNPVVPPKHLRELVPEELRYQLCGDAFVMAMVYQGAWNGYYKCPYGIGKEPVPAMVILLGDRLANEELRNPDLWRK